MRVCVVCIDLARENVYRLRTLYDRYCIHLHEQTVAILLICIWRMRFNIETYNYQLIQLDYNKWSEKKCQGKVGFDYIKRLHHQGAHVGAAQRNANNGHCFESNDTL